MPNRLSAADANPLSRNPAAGDPCNNDPRNRLLGDGRASIEGANDNGFKGGEGGRREGAGPDGEGGGKSVCKLLPCNLPRSVGGCGGGLDGEGAEEEAGCTGVCSVRGTGCDKEEA